MTRHVYRSLHEFGINYFYENFNDFKSVLCVLAVFLHGNEFAMDKLSQSYNEGIQRLSGNEKAIPDDFEIPAHIIEERKKTWNDLFVKYLSNTSAIELEIRAPETKDCASDDNDDEEVIDLDDYLAATNPKEELLNFDDNACASNKRQHASDLEEHEDKIINESVSRMPLRKPMSVVQHWINTGNLPYNSNCNDKSHSDSGTSLEEELLESEHSRDSSCTNRNSNLEKQSCVSNTFNNKHLIIASSSSSSVDTTAYILANNNTTKKADALAIVEGSKCDKEQLDTVDASKCIESVVDKLKNCKTPIIVKTNSDLSAEKTDDHALSRNETNNLNKSTEYNSTEENKVISKSSIIQETPLRLKRSSDSTESVTQTLYTSTAQLKNFQESQNSLCTKLIKRKKLYHCTESPVELTPGSEDNFSIRSERIRMNKCEHPALQSPRLHLRPSFLVGFKKHRHRKKRRSRLHTLMALGSLNSKLSCDSSNSNVKVKSDRNTETEDSDSSTIIQNSFYEETKEQKLIDNKSRRESLRIVVHKLPYIYKVEEIQNVNLNLNLKNDNKSCILNTDLHLNNNKIFDPINDLFENKTENKKSFKKFSEKLNDIANEHFSNTNVTSINKSVKSDTTHNSEKDKTVKIKNCKTAHTTTISDDKIRKQNHTLTNVSKFTVVISSSDESDDTIKKNSPIKRKLVKQKSNGQTSTELNSQDLAIPDSESPKKSKLKRKSSKQNHTTQNKEESLDKLKLQGNNQTNHDNKKSSKVCTNATSDKKLLEDNNFNTNGKSRSIKNNKISKKNTVKKTNESTKSYLSEINADKPVIKPLGKCNSDYNNKISSFSKINCKQIFVNNKSENVCPAQNINIIKNKECDKTLSKSVGKFAIVLSSSDESDDA